MYAIFCTTAILKGSTLTYINHVELILDVINIATIFVCLMYMFIDLIKKNLKVNVWGITLIGLTAMTVVFSKHILLFSIAVFLCSFDKDDFENLAKTSFYSLLFGLSLVITLSLFGAIQDLVVSRYNIVRRTLGFHSATQPQAIIMFIILLNTYIHKTKIKISTLFFELLLVCFIYDLTNSRVGFYLSMLIITITLIIKIIHFINQKLNKEDKILNIFHNKFIKIVVLLIPILITILFGILVYLYKFDLSFIDKLNELLSGRIEFTYNAFKNHKITLFGSNINWMSENGSYIGVDNAAYHYLFTYGIVGFIISVAIYTGLLYVSLKAKNYWLLMCILICLLDGFIEPYLLDIKYSVYIFMISTYLVGWNKRKELKNE